MVEYMDYNFVFGLWGKTVFKLLTSGPFFFFSFFPFVFEFTKTESRTKILH